MIFDNLTFAGVLIVVPYILMLVMLQRARSASNVDAKRVTHSLVDESSDETQVDSNIESSTAPCMSRAA